MVQFIASGTVINNEGSVAPQTGQLSRSCCLTRCPEKQSQTAAVAGLGRTASHADSIASTLVCIDKLLQLPEAFSSHICSVLTRLVVSYLRIFC